MKLMIIESPGKIKKLSAILGADWKIAASVGHIRDLPRNEMGVEAPDFVPQYELTERGAEVVAKLKGLVKDASEIYLATDPDREGEAISWHLQECLKAKNPRRVTFNEITATAVNAALAEPRQIDLQRVWAQEARRVLDRLVGYMVSPALSKAAGEKLSAGRVQSPAVRIIVERERAIRAFKVTNHFGASLDFAGSWSVEWLTKPDFVTEESPYFMDRAFASAVAGVRSVGVKAFSEDGAKRSPPAPFTTSTLQQAASVVLNLDPKAAMETAQKLYEQGHISYHRTDNPNVSADSMPDIRAVAAGLGLEVVSGQRMFKAPEGAQVGHPAITPTHWEVEAAGETNEQQALYKLIRLRAIACQLADARYAVRTVRLVGDVAGKAVEFEGKGRTLTFAGWLALTAGDQTEEGEGEEAANPIPVCQPGQRLEAVAGKLLEKKTKAPGRYTQAALVRKLESEGIGRPATYAAIMDNIVTRGYVKTEKKFLVPTKTGEMIVDALVGKFGFLDLGYTKAVEGALDRIAKGEVAYQAVAASVHRQLEKELGNLTPMDTGPAHECPECHKPMRKIPGKAGAFWGCTGYPDCKITLPDVGGKPGKPGEGKPAAKPKAKGKGGSFGAKKW